MKVSCPWSVVRGWLFVGSDQFFAAWRVDRFAFTRRGVKHEQLTTDN
jgi:hypothetical protein